MTNYLCPNCGADLRWDESIIAIYDKYEYSYYDSDDDVFYFNTSGEEISKIKCDRCGYDLSDFIDKEGFNFR